MRILASADVHGFMEVYRWLARVAREEQPELLILAGDLLSSGWEEEQRGQAPEIVAAMRVMPVPVFYLMGNDDVIALDVEDEQIRFLHGNRIEWCDFNFVGYQYTLPFVGRIFEKREDEMERDLAEIEPLLDARTVLVTHGPAHGVLDTVFWSGEHVGSTSLARMLERRPVLAHIHGHVHGCFGRSGGRFNVASAGEKRALLIELPLLKHVELHG